MTARPKRIGKNAGMVDALHTAVYVLAGVAAAEAVAIATVSVLLVRSRREAEELRRRTDTRSRLLTGGREAVKQSLADG